MITDRFYPGHGLCLKAARALGRFTERDLVEKTGLRPAAVMQNVRAWVARGVVRTVGTSKSPVTYELTGTDPLPLSAASAQDGPQPSMALHLWIAARGLRTFTPTDIAVSASTDDLPIETRDAKQFCAMLLRGGYLKVVRKAVAGKKEASYRLVRDSGPNPPRERRIQGIFDDNLGEFVYLPEVTS